MDQKPSGEESYSNNCNAIESNFQTCKHITLAYTLFFVLLYMIYSLGTNLVLLAEILSGINILNLLILMVMDEQEEPSNVLMDPMIHSTLKMIIFPYNG